MMTRHSVLDDRRGVTPAVAHVLTISITTLLLVALLTAAGGYLENQREATAREELRTIGNRLASELARVDTLGQYGGNATIRTQHPDQIAGGGYTVGLENEETCDDIDETGVSGAPCLVLESHGFDIVEKVPVRNETTVSLTTVASGTFVLSGTPQSSTSVGGREELTARGDLSEYVGVGEDIQEDPLETRLEHRNLAPVPRFEVRPYPPTTGQTITLDANDSNDPDGNITEYKWDIGGDGSWNYTGEDEEEVTHEFGSPGRNEIELEVVDDHRTPANASVTRNVTVSGLEYQENLSTAGSGDSVQFTLYNNWSEPVRLSEVFVDPDDDNIESLDAECEEDHHHHHDDDCEGDDSDSEVRIDEDDDGDIDTRVDYSDGEDFWGVSEGKNIPNSGVILDVDQKPGEYDDLIGGAPVVPKGSQIRIELHGFQEDNMEDKEMRIGVTYVHDGDGVETIFEDKVEG